MAALFWCVVVVVWLVLVLRLWFHVDVGEFVNGKTTMMVLPKVVPAPMQCDNREEDGEIQGGLKKRKEKRSERSGKKEEEGER